MEPSTNVDGDQRHSDGDEPGQARLQWSRRRTSTETARWIRGARRRIGASMEPSTNVDGDRRRWRSALRPHPCFNGAVDERRRRRAASSGSAPRLASFNGAVDERRRRPPRPRSGRARSPSFNGAVDERRRRRNMVGHAGAGFFELQWSRRRTSTETARADSGGTRGARASMEPSTNVDGDGPSGIVAIAAQVASMEPSTNVDGDGRGDGVSGSEVARFNGAVDERRRRPSTASAFCSGQSWLQWSRRRTSTETRRGA